MCFDRCCQNGAFNVLLENLQVLLECDIILLVGNYSVWRNFSGQKTYIFTGPKMKFNETLFCAYQLFLFFDRSSKTDRENFLLTSEECKAADSSSKVFRVFHDPFFVTFFLLSNALVTLHLLHFFHSLRIENNVSVN